MQAAGHQWLPMLIQGISLGVVGLGRDHLPARLPALIYPLPYPGMSGASATGTVSIIGWGRNVCIAFYMPVP